MTYLQGKMPQPSRRIHCDGEGCGRPTDMPTILEPMKKVLCPDCLLKWQAAGELDKRPEPKNA